MAQEGAAQVRRQFWVVNSLIPLSSPNLSGARLALETCLLVEPYLYP